jgi:hypothetical protein
MDAEKSITELLGVDKDALAHKCSKATRFLLESKLFGGKSTEEFIKHMEESFNEKELFFLAIGYITDKTDSIMNNDPAIANIIEKSAVKYGMPTEIVDVVKSALGIKPEQPN